MLFSRFLRPRAILNRHVTEVGWLLQTDHARFLWDAPRPLKRIDTPPQHAKSVAFCPAVIDQENRLFEVTCPFDLQLRIQINENGEASLNDTAGDESGINPRSLSQLSIISQRRQWKHPDRPLVQLKTPYTFIADEQVYLSQMPPFLSYKNPQWPGVVIGGRIPIHIWPRPLSWAFEWHDISQRLIIRRGEPWFYVRFETKDASRHVRLIEAELTPKLKSYFAGINGVVNYMNGTFSLFATAQARRPKQLLVKVKR